MLLPQAPAWFLAQASGPPSSCLLRALPAFPEQRLRCECLSWLQGHPADTAQFRLTLSPAEDAKCSLRVTASWRQTGRQGLGADGCCPRAPSLCARWSLMSTLETLEWPGRQGDSTGLGGHGQPAKVPRCWLLGTSSVTSLGRSLAIVRCGS